MPTTPEQRKENVRKVRDVGDRLEKVEALALTLQITAGQMVTEARFLREKLLSVVGDGEPPPERPPLPPFDLPPGWPNENGGE